MINHALSGKFGSTETEDQANEVLNALLEDDFLIENFLEDGKREAERKVDLYNVLIDGMDNMKYAIPFSEGDVKEILTTNKDYAGIKADYLKHKNEAL